MTSISKILIKADYYCGYTPVISILSNTVNIISKVIFLLMPPWVIHKNQYFEYIHNKTIIRCIAEMPPVLGWLLVPLYQKIQQFILKYDPSWLYYAEMKFKADKELVLNYLKTNFYSLEYVSESLRDDKEVVLAAMNLDSSELKFASTRLRNNKEVVLKSFKKGYFQRLMYASAELKADREIVLAAVNANGFELESAADNFRDDKEVVLIALSNLNYRISFGYQSEFDRRARLLKSLSDNLRNDRDVVLRAVRSYGDLLEYVPDIFKSDREVVFAALNNYKYALKLVSDELRSDKEVVLAAVRRDGYQLQWASSDLQADYEVVLEAIKSPGSFFLNHASASLRDNKDIVLAAVRKNRDQLQYASDNLKKDLEFLAKAVEENHDSLDVLERIIPTWKNYEILRICLSNLSPGNSRRDLLVAVNNFSRQEVFIEDRFGYLRKRGFENIDLYERLRKIPYLQESKFASIEKLSSLKDLNFSFR